MAVPKAALAAALAVAAGVVVAVSGGQSVPDDSNPIKAGKAKDGTSFEWRRDYVNNEVRLVPVAIRNGEAHVADVHYNYEHHGQLGFLSHLGPDDVRPPQSVAPALVLEVSNKQSCVIHGTLSDASARPGASEITMPIDSQRNAIPSKQHLMDCRNPPPCSSIEGLETRGLKIL